jgi:alkylation response protein AidB-like acyl-CoA dehydrogenase
MAQLFADRRDIDFVLHEQLAVDQLSQNERYRDFGRKTVDMIITEARNLAVKEILPTSKIGDRVGCTFENGVVTVPPEFTHAWKLLVEGEWLGLSDSPEWGGQGMPETVAAAAREYLINGNITLMIYAALTHGSARLVETFGSEELKKLYLEKMLTGAWAGTMVLTEPEAGSDLGMIQTSATQNGDGTYAISGSKVFISSGEHELTPNIIHFVLARIEGAPPGSKGVSLFLVPKYLVNQDGSLGERNDVVCTGVEEKLGLHGNPTCSLSFGSRGQCIGWLVGEENRGLSQMFLMMNEERLMVGLQGFATASAAYMDALEFARNRIQGPKLGAKELTPVAIINHPDVRRMLLTMKMYTEGMRSLIYYISTCEDRRRISENEEERERLGNLVDVLIPVAKGYVTDRAVELCNMGLQVYGGYGYIREYPMEQRLRDVRITPIYEGTNGIQAMDLLGRKLGRKQGRLFMDLMGEMKKVAAEGKETSAVVSLAEKFDGAVERLGKTAMRIGMAAMGAELYPAFSFAGTFLEVTGDVVIAWMLLWRATIAARAMEQGASKKDAPYYEGQLKSAQYFIQGILPVTSGKMDAIDTMSDAAVTIADEAFG